MDIMQILKDQMGNIFIGLTFIGLLISKLSEVQAVRHFFTARFKKQKVETRVENNYILHDVSYELEPPKISFLSKLKWYEPLSCQSDWVDIKTSLEPSSFEDQSDRKSFLAKYWSHKGNIKQFMKDFNLDSDKMNSPIVIRYKVSDENFVVNPLYRVSNTFPHQPDHSYIEEISFRLPEHLEKAAKVLVNIPIYWDPTQKDLLGIELRYGAVSAGGFEAQIRSTNAKTVRDQIPANGVQSITSFDVIRREVELTGIDISTDKNTKIILTWKDLR